MCHSTIATGKRSSTAGAAGKKARRHRAAPGVGALFAAAANSYLAGTYVPDTNEFSLADIVNLLGIGTILITLTESTISLWIYETLDDPPLSRRLDRRSFWTILIGFGVSLALILAGALSHGEHAALTCRTKAWQSGSTTQHERGDRAPLEAKKLDTP